MQVLPKPQTLTNLRIHTKNIDIPPLLSPPRTLSPDQHPLEIRLHPLPSLLPIQLPNIPHVLIRPRNHHTPRLPAHPIPLVRLLKPLMIALIVHVDAVVIPAHLVIERMQDVGEITKQLDVDARGGVAREDVYVFMEVGGEERSEGRSDDGSALLPVLHKRRSLL